MLAERKNKMKWSPNPCGNLWSKDNSKFGQKMLEKFGWTPGKGLGAKEQGIINPVRLKCNSTQKGLGYERGKRVEFFQHQEEFSSILSNLNSSNSGSDSKESCLSLEKASKNCKTRVHYHKFTRGKDLSRYSEKDLSCILGVVSALENTVVSRQQNSLPTEGDDEQNWESAEINNLYDEQNRQLSDRQESEKDKDKKKRKRKCDSFNDESNSTNEIVEFEKCRINIDSCTEERITVLRRNIKKKNNRKRKYEDIDDNTFATNESLIDDEASDIKFESHVEELNTVVLSENWLNKRKRKKGVKNTLDEGTIEISETLTKFEENQINDNFNNEDSSDKISKKTKKKHKKE